MLGPMMRSADSLRRQLTAVLEEAREPWEAAELGGLLQRVAPSDPLVDSARAWALGSRAAGPELAELVVDLEVGDAHAALRDLDVACAGFTLLGWTPEQRAEVELAADLVEAWPERVVAMAGHASALLGSAPPRVDDPMRRVWLAVEACTWDGALTGDEGHPTPRELVQHSRGRTTPRWAGSQLAEHLQGCGRCARRAAVLREGAHFTWGTLLLALHAPPESFPRVHAEAHAAVCPQCQALLFGLRDAPALDEVRGGAALLRAIRRAPQPVMRSVGAVLELQVVGADGQARQGQARLVTGRIDTAGELLLVLEVPPDIELVTGLLDLPSGWLRLPAVRVAAERVTWRRALGEVEGPRALPAAWLRLTGRARG